jgi:hypothetical protein
MFIEYKKLCYVWNLFQQVTLCDQLGTLMYFQRVLTVHHRGREAIREDLVFNSWKIEFVRCTR